VLAQVPFLLVLAVVAIGMVRIAEYHWRQGTVLIGIALLLGAVLRAVLPGTRVGLIALRGRAVDILTYTAFGVVVVAIALTMQGGPLTS
jgi:hypothetical protein